MKREKQIIETDGLQDKPKINKKSHELASKFDSQKKLQRLQRNIFKNNKDNLRHAQEKLQKEKGWNYTPSINKNSKKIFMSN